MAQFRILLVDVAGARGQDDPRPAVQAARALCGQYVVEYDPLKGRTETFKGGTLITGSASEARRFKSRAQAWEYWRQSNGRVRPDGRDDRPLTAYTVMIEEAK